MRFADPEWLLLLIPAALALWLRRGPWPGSWMGFPAAPFFAGAGGRRAALAGLPVALRAGSLALAILALARPQAPSGAEEEPLRGRNVLVALDVSSSMRSEDFRPRTRLHVAKELLVDFIRRREGDLVGLLVFAARPLTLVPLTTETDVLAGMLQRVEVGILPDGTGIGTALGASLARLSELPSGSSTVVLITDGVNNTGKVDPLTAAEAARALGIRVHTIGVSARGRDPAVRAWSPARLRDVQEISGVDEEVLRRIAGRTGGRYYRAADPGALSRVLREIDRLETTQIGGGGLTSFRELYPRFLYAALALLALGLLLRATWLRALP